MNQKVIRVSSTHMLIKLKKYEKPPPEYFSCLIAKISRLVEEESPHHGSGASRSKTSVLSTKKQKSGLVT